MTVETARPSDSYGLWLILSCGLVTCAAVFAAARIKPPIVFAIGDRWRGFLIVKAVVLPNFVPQLLDALCGFLLVHGF